MVRTPFPSVEQDEPGEETDNRHHCERIPDDSQDCYVGDEEIGCDQQTEA